MQHSQEFKDEAIFKALNSDKSVAKIAKELNISSSTLYRWLKDHRQNSDENLSVEKKVIEQRLKLKYIDEFVTDKKHA